MKAFMEPAKNAKHALPARKIPKGSGSEARFIVNGRPANEALKAQNPEVEKLRQPMPDIASWLGNQVTSFQQQLNPLQPFNPQRETCTINLHALLD